MGFGIFGTWDLGGCWVGGEGTGVLGLLMLLSSRISISVLFSLFRLLCFAWANTIFAYLLWRRGRMDEYLSTYGMDCLTSLLPARGLLITGLSS
ncbi:uncharacterized protein B0H64DRAFT_111600 [Chaetomium fimeti]|jgi:hypothetical protein|uniref:Uncharacterized protein n=1 Tax=Chaetomium fimeti TaxID=1854472 RepID=A0AAE0LTF0_9PEZI|nr:hypothetical protein B0H64DRAFT_111600 [Chaetomium fimeti]